MRTPFAQALRVLLCLSPLLGIGLCSKGYLDRCPPYEILYPCYCNSIPRQEERLNCTGLDTITYRCQVPVITCISHQLDRFDGIFSKVASHISNVNYRKFEWLYLVAHDLTALKNDSLEHMFFRNIYIKSCPNLLVLHEGAFGQSNAHYTRNLFINATSLSDEPRLKRSTFRALSSLRELEVLEIQTSNFTSLPYKAFNRRTNVRIIRFYNPDELQHLRVIGSRAFFKANLLEEIDLKRNRISQIKPFAFQFQRSSHHDVRVFLSGNLLSSDSFEVNSLLGGNGRNMILYLGDYNDCNSQLTTLRQEVFQPFLDENRGNVVDMYGCPLLCDHRMEWLTLNLERYRSQVRNIECFTESRFLSKDNYNYYHVSHRSG